MGIKREVPDHIEKISILIVLTALLSFLASSPVFPASSSQEPLWEQTNGPPGGSFGLIEFNPGNPDIMYAGSGYSFFRSEDGGDHWTRVDQLHELTWTLELGVRDLVFDPRDPDTLYLGCRGGVFKSTDAGVTWTSLTTGFEGLCVQDVVLDPVEPDIVYFIASYGGGDNFVYKSLDGGGSWADISSNFPSTYEITMLVAVSHDELYSGGGFEMAREGDPTTAQTGAPPGRSGTSARGRRPSPTTCGSTPTTGTTYTLASLTPSTGGGS